MERRSSTRGKGNKNEETPNKFVNMGSSGKVEKSPVGLNSSIMGTRSASMTKKGVSTPAKEKVNTTVPVKETKEKKINPVKVSITAEVVVKDNEVAMSSKGMCTMKSTLTTSIPTQKENKVAQLTKSIDSQPAEPSGEEVVLNRRGMPQRQRKRNRLYYDDEFMVTSEASPARKMIPKAKIKEEPLDTSDRAESPTFPHNEVVATAPVKRGLHTKKIYSSRPTPVQVAQAVTQMVKPRISVMGKILKGGRPSSSVLSKRSVVTPKKPTKGARSVGKSPRVNSVKNSYENTVTSAEKRDPKQMIKVKGAHKDNHCENTVVVAKSGDFVIIKEDPDALLFEHPPGENAGLAKTRESAPEATRNDKKPKERQFREKELQKRVQRSRRMSSPNEALLGLRSGTPTEIMVESEKPSLDKKTAQEISLRLRNLLKLPKAHKWVCYEWFYSNIDKVLFEGENDFQICFKESFPQLKTRKLTRVEWTKLRRLMGKPRRCSYAFFDEEREELARRRQKIRMIQQRKVTDFNYKELPDEIPLQLVIGTKVTTRLRRPQDGLFTGTIEGVDTSNNTYRITFDRIGLGTHSIPDYEVLSNELPETVSTSSFALKIPRRSYFTGNQFKLNAALGDELNKYAKSPFPVDGMLGGFPIRLLDMIVRLSKLLKAKREKILQLKELNVEAEKMRSYNKSYNDDFRTRYARVVLDLESMNKEMNVYLDGVQQYCLEIAADHGANQMVIPQQVKEQCDQEAALIVNTYNTRQNREAVHGTMALSLISKLASLMLQIKTLSSGDRNLFELKSLKDSLKEIKASLNGKNVQTFQDLIEIPMNRIQAGLTFSQNRPAN